MLRPTATRTVSEWSSEKMTIPATRATTSGIAQRMYGRTMGSTVASAAGRSLQHEALDALDLHRLDTELRGRADVGERADRVDRDRRAEAGEGVAQDELVLRG